MLSYTKLQIEEAFSAHLFFSVSIEISHATWLYIEYILDGKMMYLDKSENLSV